MTMCVTMVDNHCIYKLHLAWYVESVMPNEGLRIFSYLYLDHVFHHKGSGAYHEYVTRIYSMDVKQTNWLFFFQTVGGIAFARRNVLFSPIPTWRKITEFNRSKIIWSWNINQYSVSVIFRDIPFKTAQTYCGKNCGSGRIVLVSSYQTFTPGLIRKRATGWKSGVLVFWDW